MTMALICEVDTNTFGQSLNRSFVQRQFDPVDDQLTQLPLSTAVQPRGFNPCNTEQKQFHSETGKHHLLHGLHSYGASPKPG